MARYLTPSKIGLLALIQLYTDLMVPTSATIPILSFIVARLLPFQPPTEKPLGSLSNDQSSLILIEDFQKLTIVHSSGIPGRTIWDLFLKKLWDINSFDALHGLFDDLSMVLVKTREEHLRDLEQGLAPPPEHMILLSRNSPLGTFVRRVQLEFTRVQFHDSMTLWNSFVQYRKPTLGLWRKRNPTAGPMSFDTNLQSEGLTWEDALTCVLYGTEEGRTSSTSDGFVSTSETEKLLEFQVEKMQKIGHRMPEGIKGWLSALLRDKGTVPSLLHYVRFLDAWRAGDYPTSFDNLHRYFDYTMHNHDRTFYQYALLNLAFLQADFGCYVEAVAAMQETISTARENKDMACLNFSLSWLYHFGKAHPVEMEGTGTRGTLGLEREDLAFLRTKAKEASMWSLWSTSLLSEAKLGLSSGDSVPIAFENILRGSHLNITKSLANVMGSQMLLQSSLWSRLGVTHLAWSFTEVFLQCYAEPSPLEDILKCMCRSAYIMTEKGHYEAARARMDEVERDWLRALRLNQYWAVFCGILKLKRELRRNNLNVADRLLLQLLSQPSSDPEVSYEISILQIELLIRRSSYAEGLSKLDNIATSLKEANGDIDHRVHLLTLKAIMLHKCGRPEKGFSVAVRAASIALRARLLPSLWEAIGAVANILLQLKDFAAAGKLASAIMPQVLEYENSALSAYMYSILVDAHMGLAGAVKRGSSKRKECLTKASEFIDNAFAEFSHIKDIQGQCDMMAKKATIMHLVGDLVLANDYAAKYLDLKRQGGE